MKSKEIGNIFIGKTNLHYRQDIIIKKYARFFRFLPMDVRYQHGWYGQLKDNMSDLNASPPFMLLWNNRISGQWNEKSSTPSTIITAPFVIFRRLHNVEPQPEANGTVAFPHHSSRSKIPEYDINVYCEQLKKLPQKYHPIDICLHHLDYEKQRPAFEKHGFNVLTAGNNKKASFVRNFYSILTNHRFSTSNTIGSYTFYSIELGIPFFLLGDKAEIIYKKQKSLGIPITAPILPYVENLFSTIQDTIPEEQTEFVLSELGVKDGISRKELRKILYKVFLFHTIPRVIKRIVKLTASKIFHRK